MAFPTTSLVDDFNRADTGPPPSSNWTGPIISGNDGYKVVSNQATPNTVACSDYWNAATFGPDTEAYVTVASSADGDYTELFVRLAPVGPNGYLARFRRADANPGYTNFIYRCDSGSFTQLTTGTDNSAAFSANDKLGVEIIGTTITMYRFHSGAWTAGIQATGDATYSAAGNIGMRTPIGATETYDDFSGDTIAAAAVPVSARPFDAIPFM